MPSYSTGRISPSDDTIRRLESDLWEARYDIVNLMPSHVANMLRDYHSCVSREDYYSWERKVVEKIVSLAAVDSGISYFQERGYCPLCRGGSSGPYERGFTLPEGLRRHLTGDVTARHCPVTKAAFALAHSSLRASFDEADAAKQKQIDERRKTENVFLVEPEFSPRFLDEGLWIGKPRNTDELKLAEDKLPYLGFLITKDQNIISYTFSKDCYVVLADPRALGRIDFCVFPNRTAKGRRRLRTGRFHLLDSWKNDLKGKFEQRLTIAISSLGA